MGDCGNRKLWSAGVDSLAAGEVWSALCQPSVGPDFGCVHHEEKPRTYTEWNAPKNYPPANATVECEMYDGSLRKGTFTCSNVWGLGCHNDCFDDDIKRWRFSPEKAEEMR